MSKPKRSHSDTREAHLKVIEYVESLVQSRKFEEALDFAEQHLGLAEDDPRTFLRFNLAILVCRQQVGEFYGASTIGQLCVKMSAELDEWDLFGKSCFYLGISYGFLGQEDEALQAWQDYLDRLDKYDTMRPFEGRVRYNIALAKERQGDNEGAIKEFSRALSAAQKHGLTRYAHGIRHALIGTYIRLRMFGEVPRLLAQSLNYIHHHSAGLGPEDFSRLWHFVKRAEFAIGTGRYRRAELLARKGLSEATNQHRMRVAFLMIMAEAKKIQGFRETAVEYCLEARSQAIACRRYDLELQAAEFMYRLLAVE